MIRMLVPERSTSFGADLSQYHGACRTLSQVY